MNNSQKISVQESLGKMAKGNAEDVVSLLARCLPASVVSITGAIATVKFEVLSEYNMPQIKVPVLGSLYVREPLQAGDKGILIPCGASISAISGMGQNTADLSTPANLSALAFLPIGNKNWGNVDGKMLVLTGLSDLMLRDNSHQVQLEDMNTSFAALVTRINALLLVIGPLLTNPTTLTPLNAVEINPIKARAQ